jgi:hypothetical protein
MSQKMATFVITAVRPLKSYKNCFVCHYVHTVTNALYPIAKMSRFNSLQDRGHSLIHYVYNDSVAYIECSGRRQIGCAGSF